MILLPAHIAPDTTALNKLQGYQAQIDALPDFAQQAAKAKTLFSQANKKGNTAFDEVKLKLTEMCSGARRCVYCEDSVADEVEHMRPKDLYPGHCFKWENYVYACGNCNGPKNNKYAVFRATDGQFVTVNPPKGMPAAQPPDGDDALIDPRTEDPLDYCMLDITETFKFVVMKPDGTKEAKKADYTFNEILRLNQREHLVKARKNAYGNYKARLFQYHHQKTAGAGKPILDKLIEGVKTESHPTVWKEMQRYYRMNLLIKVDTDLHDLFAAVPEASGW
jgi:hypothetical protein